MSLDDDMADLVQRGARHLSTAQYGLAAESFLAAAERTEIPDGEVCVHLARALLKDGRPGEAAAWATRAVDGGEAFKTWLAAAGLLRRCPPETWPRVRRRLRLAVAGTWTTSAFAPLLQLALARLGIAATLHEVGFGQYFSETLDPGSALYAGAPEAVVLCPEYRALGLPAFSDDTDAAAEAAVARWSGVWSALNAAAQPIIVQHGFAHPGMDPLGHFGAGLPGARRNLVARINRALAARAVDGDVGYLDLAALAAEVGRETWFDDRGWYMAKMPYGPAALPQLARHTAAVIAARLGYSRRCVVVDLDNTLWGGVIGDDGLEGIVLGQGADGEAYQDFQAALKELTSRGIVLAACSKNDPEVARQPFREHPETVLREDDFAAFVANWGPKSDNIREIARILGLGLESLTFLDDNPYERAEVRRALPELDVPVLPKDPTGYRRALESYPHFEPSAFTAADRDRAGQYRARAEAETLRGSASSLEDYQASLGMKATFGPIDAVNMARVVQLINKTNQFNLTTRRRTQAEVEAFLADPSSRHCWVRLADKFADHGLIAVVLARAEAGRLKIDTLLMSCRVLGRGVESLILAELARIAVAAGCRQVAGTYIPTGRNRLVADLYPRLGFERVAEEGDGRTTWRAPAETLMEASVPITVEWI